MKKTMIKILLALIKLYQVFLSPFLGPACRFYPSCSDYAHESLEKHGLFRGLHRAAVRLLKCHPFHPGGYDPA